MPTDADKERARKGIKARQDAVATLIANHRDEFDRLHTQNRVAAGLPIKPQGATREELQERIRKQEEKLARWREELAQAS